MLDLFHALRKFWGGNLARGICLFLSVIFLSFKSFGFGRAAADAFSTRAVYTRASFELQSTDLITQLVAVEPLLSILNYFS